MSEFQEVIDFIIALVMTLESMESLNGICATDSNDFYSRLLMPCFDTVTKYGGQFYLNF